MWGGGIAVAFNGMMLKSNSVKNGQVVHSL
jgi:hypothetical protein